MVPSSPPLNPVVQHVLDSLADPFFVLSGEWRYVYINAHAARALGATPAALLGESLWQGLDEARERRLGAEYRHVMSTREVRQFEVYSPTQGSWLEVKAFPYEDGIAVHARDISARKRDEARTQALSAVSAALATAASPHEVIRVLVEHGRAAVGASAGTVVLLQRDGRTLRVEAERGYDPQTMRAWQTFDLHLPMPAADAVRTQAPVYLPDRAAVAQRYGQMVGLLRPATHSQATLPLLVEGRALGALVFSFDEPRPFPGDERVFLEALAGQLALVLERARLFEAEHEARTRAAFLAQAGEVLASSLDVRATLERVTQLALTGLADWCAVYVPGEDGRPTPIAVAHHDPAKVALLRRYLTDYPSDPEAPYSNAYVMRSGQGVLLTRIPPESIAALADEEQRALVRALGLHSLISVPLLARGETLGVLGLATTRPEREYGEDDLTLAQELARRTAVALDNARLYEATVQNNAALERRVEDRTRELAQRNEQLLRSNRDLEQFAYVASHDLKAPLRTVTSYMQLLQRKYQGQLDDKADRYIAFAVEAVGRMNALIEDVLAYSRLGRETRVAHVDAERALDEVLDNLQGTLDACGARLSRAPLPAVHADETQLRQVLQNLIGNAVKFQPAGRRPEVRVAACVEDAFVHFTVADNGIGIAPQYHERIFGVFQRLHPAEAFSGTGVGLAIVKKIVEEHGGRIWVESREGEGTAFHFTLPAANTALPASAAS